MYKKKSMIFKTIIKEIIMKTIKIKDEYFKSLEEINNLWYHKKYPGEVIEEMIEEYFLRENKRLVLTDKFFEDYNEEAI